MRIYTYSHIYTYIYIFVCSGCGATSRAHWAKSYRH